MHPGQKIKAAYGYSTIWADIDFETYSEAGYHFSLTRNKWVSVVDTPPHGLRAVGAAVYAEHPSTEVLSLAYDLKNGNGPILWTPNNSTRPQDLFDYIARGGIIEAWNSLFEYFVWAEVCHKRMGWPELPYTQLRDPAAKARSQGLPGALDKAGRALNADLQKMPEGKRLIQKFSVPRNPTKKDSRRRIRLEDDPEDAKLFYKYNLGDIKAQAAISRLLPDLSDFELKVWLLDQKINIKGVQTDTKAVENCTAIVEQCHEQYTKELQAITSGAVQTANELAKMIKWLGSIGVRTGSLDADTVDLLLRDNDALPPRARRVLEIRKLLGSASVKKLYAIERRASADGRLRGMFVYYGAERTGRFAGRGPQPHNLPGSGPTVRQCDETSGCGKYFGTHLDKCPWCSLDAAFSAEADWSIEAAENALEVISWQDLTLVEYFFGDALEAVAGCLRALFIAGPGKELICSDYSAIEAVVLAVLSNEQWRLEVFRTHGKIYEASASKITGVPFEDFLKYKEDHSHNHPLRKKIGKPAELASGYQGAVGAWKQFGADKYLNDDEILDGVKAWRKTNPNIVKFWYGMDDAAKAAIRNPGQCYSYGPATYGMHEDVLYCKLPSGRFLVYREPRLAADTTYSGKPTEKITFMGWNSNSMKGAVGWVRMDTYGGKLTADYTQATAREVLCNAMLQLDAACYTPVLHVHDEPIAEVTKGFGSVAEFESLLLSLPGFANIWPIRVGGGWRGKRFRK